MSTMSIKVSIIVPVYNTKNYLTRCLESLVHQSLNEIEILLINDCSTDGSLAILEKYKEKYPDKITIINLKENRGPGGARNEGICIAKGEYLGFVDSDDDVSLNMFEELYKIAHEEDYDMVDCRFYHEPFNMNMGTTHQSALGELNLEKRRELFMHAGFLWSKLIKRKIIIENQIEFREKAAYEDIDFLRVVIFYCKTISSTEQILYNYRNNGASITNGNNLDAQVYQKMDAMKALAKKFIALGVYDVYQEELIYLIYKTYMFMVNYVVALEKKDVSLKVFKELHDFFFELVKCEYQSNKYILQFDEDDRLAAEINNEDYTKLLSICFD